VTTAPPRLAPAISTALANFHCQFPRISFALVGTSVGGGSIYASNITGSSARSVFNQHPGGKIDRDGRFSAILSQS
jgi:hypothetical protein